MTKKHLGVLKKFMIVNKMPYFDYIPLMNPVYLTEENLWDIHDEDKYEFNETLFD